MGLSRKGYEVNQIADQAVIDREERRKAMKPTVPDVLPITRAYYAKDGNGAGGNLHIVLDDCNVKDGHVIFCKEQCIQRGDSDGLALCELLLRMSRTQRLKIAREI